MQGLIDLDFEVELTGFEMGEIDLILDEPTSRRETAGPEDDIVEPLPGPDHQSAGDSGSRQASHLCAAMPATMALMAMLDGEKAEFVFTDPPYNVPIDGNVCGHGAVRHREFAMASGEMSPEASRGF